MVHPSIIGIIAVIALLNVSHVIAGPPESGCCWAQQGQQYHYNATYTYTGSLVLLRVYTQVDTNTGKFHRIHILCFFCLFVFLLLHLLSYRTSTSDLWMVPLTSI
jgi:hypothetical protein